MQSTNTHKIVHDAVIVGGGHNGLVCAAYLAKAGLDVMVLERRHIVGGACVTEELFPGYQLSTFAYIVYILQDKIVQDLQLRKYGFDVHPLIIKRFFPYEDGRSLIFWNDSQRTAQDIAKNYSKQDAEGYLKWQEFWFRSAQLFNEHFLSEPPTIDSLKAQVRGTEDEALIERLINGLLGDLLDECFVSEEMKGAVICHLLTTKSLDTPGTLLTHACSRPNALIDRGNRGIAVGGMGTVTQALARSAQSLGVKIRCGAEVERILLDDSGQAVGVELVDGQVIRSRQVISNADPKRTFLGLVGKENLSIETADYIGNLETACATLKFHAIMDELPDFSRQLGQNSDPRYLADVGICPSFSYYQQSLTDAQEGRITEHPLIDIQMPTVYDRTIAPDGKHILSMWVRYYPVSPPNVQWHELRERIGNQLIDQLTELAPNFRRSIIDWLIYTPDDIEQRVYMTDGNFRHTDHSPDQLLANRLFSNGGYQTPVPGLYMCGAGTYPGGDVSGAPGHNAAHKILDDLRVKGGLPPK